MEKNNIIVLKIDADIYTFIPKRFYNKNNQLSDPEEVRSVIIDTLKQCSQQDLDYDNRFTSLVDNI